VKFAARLIAASVLLVGAALRGSPPQGGAPGAGSGPIRIPLLLGQGLSYYRIHELPADIPSPPGLRAGSCVLDLRFAKSDDAAAAVLNAWVKFTASSNTPVFILENQETSAALLAAFPGSGAAGVVVLAPASEKLSPDIAVRVDSDTDRRAYDALDKGTPLASLLADNPEKPRIDEAYLEKEHLSDGDAPDVATDKPSPPSPLVDSVLQRAVQVHRGLLALKRI
jgi:hypothetical protein